MTNRPEHHQPDINQVRATVQKVLDQARKEPHYKQQLMGDPWGTLMKAGLSEPAVEHLVRYELTAGFLPDSPKGKSVDSMSPGIAPNLYCHATCDFWTCWITWCTWFTGV